LISSTKDLEETPINNDNSEIKIDPDPIKMDEFSSEQSETIETSDIRNNRTDIRNSTEIDKPFYLN
jgi:hypothetical protein